LIVVIRKAPVESCRLSSHHEDREDHKGGTWEIQPFPLSDLPVLIFSAVAF